MWDMLNKILSIITGMVAYIGSLEIVPGVSLLAFLGAIIIVGVLANQLIKRAGA